MHSDRELLELAAKAIGARPYTDRFWPGLCLSDDDECDPFYVNRHGSNAKNWNPLRKDDDALRLAVALEMLVEVEKHTARAVTKHGGHEAYQTCSDPHLATRRAIVRAAAAIQLHKENNNA